MQIPFMQSRAHHPHRPNRAPWLRRSIALILALAASACDAPPPVMTDGFTGDAAALRGDGAAPRTLVLPDPNGETRAAAIELALARLDGRLDATLGAPARPTTFIDDTFTLVRDQQFSWNGRVHDSYMNTRRTYRRAAE